MVLEKIQSDILSKNLTIYFEDAKVNVAKIHTDTAVLNMMNSKVISAEYQLDPYQMPSVNKEYLQVNGFPKDCDGWVQIQERVFPQFPELPPNWVRVVSKSHGGTYYYNTKTFVSTTELPGSRIFGELPLHDQH